MEHHCGQSPKENCTQSSYISSLTKHSPSFTRNRKKDKVDTFLHAWIDRKQSTQLNISIDLTAQFPSLNRYVYIYSNSTSRRKLSTTSTIIDYQLTSGEHSNQEELIQSIYKGSPFPPLHQDYYTENNSITLTEDNSYNSKIENTHSDDDVSLLDLAEPHDPKLDNEEEDMYNIKEYLVVLENTVYQYQ